MKALHMTAWTILIIGGLNWLVYGLSGWDVGHLFGGMTAMISRIIYVLVGLSALYELFTHKSNCKMCNPSAGMAKPSM